MGGPVFKGGEGFTGVGPGGELGTPVFRGGDGLPGSGPVPLGFPGTLVGNAVLELFVDGVTGATVVMSFSHVRHLLVSAVVAAGNLVVVVFENILVVVTVANVLDSVKF